MEIDSLFGLPAHPLIVHAAVVLLPIAAIGLIVVAAIPRARKLYAPIVLGLALVATVAVGLAQQSGESLKGDVKKTELVEEHAEQGETVLPWAIAVTVVSALVAAEPYVARPFQQALATGGHRRARRRLVDRRRRSHDHGDRRRPLGGEVGLGRRRRLTGV